MFDLWLRASIEIGFDQAALGAAALRGLPERLSWLQLIAVALAWVIAFVGGMGLIMGGASIP